MSLLPQGAPGRYGQEELLLGFLVVRVLTARIAELRELETPGGGLLVLGRRVVTVFALWALQCNDFAHLVSLTFVWPTTSVGKQFGRMKLHLTRRDAGLRRLQPLFLIVWISGSAGGRAVRPRSTPLLCTNRRRISKSGRR